MAPVRRDVELILPGHRMPTVVRIECHKAVAPTPDDMVVVGLGYKLGPDMALGVEWVPLGMASQEAEDFAKRFLADRLALEAQATELFKWPAAAGKKGS